MLFRSAEVAKENLPAGFGYELGGMAREEASTSGSTTGIIFVLCFVFVYLLLSAQYESYILPLAVLLSVPFGLMGSFIFVNGFGALGNIPALKMILGTMSNDIYMQIPTQGLSLHRPACPLEGLHFHRAAPNTTSALPCPLVGGADSFPSDGWSFVSG